MSEHLCVDGSIHIPYSSRVPCLALPGTAAGLAMKGSNAPHRSIKGQVCCRDNLSQKLTEHSAPQFLVVEVHTSRKYEKKRGQRSPLPGIRNAFRHMKHSTMSPTPCFAFLFCAFPRPRLPPRQLLLDYALVPPAAPSLSKAEQLVSNLYIHRKAVRFSYENPLTFPPFPFLHGLSPCTPRFGPLVVSARTLVSFLCPTR